MSNSGVAMDFCCPNSQASPLQAVGWILGVQYDAGIYHGVGQNVEAHPTRHGNFFQIFTSSNSTAEAALGHLLWAEFSTRSTNLTAAYLQRNCVSTRLTFGPVEDLVPNASCTRPLNKCVTSTYLDRFCMSPHGVAFCFWHATCCITPRVCPPLIDMKK